MDKRRSNVLLLVVALVGGMVIFIMALTRQREAAEALRRTWLTGDKDREAHRIIPHRIRRHH